ncbi:hypothetical protein [Curtobacterium sp. SORGH_AS_0776]|uniref:hypothetical protein n=1 Tax=Curtobacterium sp. SORGH_AS_0776 TaxID=3041798 RepID=UPI0028635652|nr:hypothetical protein [Curtobacterium sp. SORGH_AS_0776]MDR6172627.1 hypothetical protein [Curtobacterium sp. SORGH_AS_0776]
MTDDAWANFIASIDPVTLERERMRVHGNLEHERPGSRQDHEMRHAHEWLKQERIRDAIDDDMAGEIYRLQLADADRNIHNHMTEHDRKLEASIAAYRARKAA